MILGKHIFITLKKYFNTMTAHYKKLEKMYLEANIQAKLFPSTTIKIEEKLATIGINISDDYYHALNAVHGSVYFKLLDDACYFAVSSIVTDVFVLTTSFNLNLVRPVQNGTLKAVGRVRFTSKNIFTADGTLYNEQGKEIAFGTGNFAKSKVSLSKEIGYV